MTKQDYSNQWLKDLNLSRPLIIAGPCSAETEEQMLEIAKNLKNNEIDFFRAGIWKPRTRPGGFEGVGEIGLNWLKKVKEITGLKTATEVANRDHIKLALEYDIDLLWIGARTTVNPFIVQEIADELKGTDKIVLVKNPVNPDLALWIGALERLKMAGIEKLGAIHRGFSSYEKSKYRNIPEWQIPIELKNIFPNLPIICDPSHITGKRELIFDVSQTALDLNFDGLMIETHCTPDAAWSDAAQQITPERLVQIMNDLRIRQVSTNQEDYVSKLSTLRSHIDIIDDQLLDLLKKRMNIADEIGTLKKANNVAILQNQRWHEILGKVILEGEQYGLSEEFIIQVFKAIHQESINRQTAVVSR